MSIKKRLVRRTGFLAAIIVIVIIVDLMLSSFSLIVTDYGLVAQQITETIRIVQLTDIHNSEFGEENSRLIALLKEKKPDLILVTGDLLDSKVKYTDIAVTLLRKLCQIAPVYVSMGNHEVDYERNYGVDLIPVYKETGAHVLEYNYEDIEVNDQAIRIGGVYGYCLPKNGEAARLIDTDFLEEFQNTDSLKLLLAHLPLAWYRSGSLDAWNVDYVFSGHTHGGQIRIPLVGGLWAPDKGWFPGKEKGLYYSDDGSKVMVLSSGLGNTEKIPRFNNIPEVVVVDIVPAAND